MKLFKTIDYKRIIGNRKTRLKILKLLNWIPDEQMIKLQYKLKQEETKHKKSKRYTEKDSMV